MRSAYVLLLLVFALSACQQASENSGTANTSEPVNTMLPAKTKEPSNAAAHPPTGTSETTEVKVYFSEGDGTDCSAVSAATRTIPRTQGVARAALEELFKGPTEEEKRSGLSSFFSGDTKDILDGVNVKEGAAYVNLDSSVMQKLSNVTTSCGSQAFTASVEKTLLQFPTVKKVFFAIEGNPKDFYDWIQIGECPPELKNCSGRGF